MTKIDQPQGEFKMNINFRRKGNAKAATITGTISAPEDPATMYAFQAFEKEGDKGEPYWIGPVDVNRSMRQALHAQPERGTNFVAIRENNFKVFKELRDGSPNPAYAALSPEQQTLEDNKHSYWGTWTRTPDQPQIRATAWDREPNRYGPWASGDTQYPMTKEQAEALARGEMQAAEPDLKELVDSGAVSKGMPKGKNRGGREE